MSDLTPQEEESFAKAASELYEDKREELVWAKAFVEAEGDEDKARTIYIKLRAGQLTDRAAKKAPAKKAPAKKAPAKSTGAKKKHYDKCPKCRSPKWRNTIQQCSSCGYELKTGTTKRERMRQFVDEQPPTPPRAKPSSHGAGNETESKSDGCCLPVIVIVGLVALFAFTDFFGEEENSAGKGDPKGQQDAEEQFDPEYEIPRHTPFPTIKGFSLGMTKNELIENLEAIGEATIRGFPGGGEYEIRQRGEHQITFDLSIEPSDWHKEGFGGTHITAEHIDGWGVNWVTFTKKALENRALFNVPGDMSMRQFFDGLTKKHGLPSGRYWSGYVEAKPAVISVGIVIIPAEEAYMARKSITLRQKLGPGSENNLWVYPDYWTLNMSAYREDFPKEKLKPTPPPGSADFD